MRLKILMIGAAALSLAACGQAKDSFDEGIEKGFDKEFASSCTTAAVKSGAAPAVASKLCNCTADKMKAKYKGAELMRVSQQEQMALAKECMAENGIQAK